MFLEGVVYQISAFAMKAGIEPEDAVVRLILGNGDYIVMRGLKFISPFGLTEWGMLLSESSTGLEAAVIRESDVYKVELQVAGKDGPIGFLAEGVAQIPA